MRERERERDLSDKPEDSCLSHSELNEVHNIQSTSLKLEHFDLKLILFCSHEMEQSKPDWSG